MSVILFFSINFIKQIIILQQKHIILTFFLCCFVVNNHCKLYWVNTDLQSKIMIFLENNKMLFGHFCTCTTNNMWTKYHNIMFLTIWKQTNLIWMYFVDCVKWYILHQNRVVAEIDSVGLFMRWINLVHCFQCRHLVLLNRFLTSEAIITSLVSVEMVPAWSDKKNLKTERNISQTQGRRQH